MLDPRKQDEQYLLSFLMDPIAYNRFMSLKPLLQIGTEYSVQSLIDSMKKENRHSRSVYAELLKESSGEFLEFVRERLLDEDDPEIRRVCIDILSDHVENADIFLIKRDVGSNHKSLKMTALRCLNKFQSYYASQLLLKYISDKDWEVRSLTSKLVGERKAYQAIPALMKNLSDENWWVRFNAAMSLSKMDRPGLAALNSISPEHDRYAYQMAQFMKRLNYKAEDQIVAKKLNFENIRKSDGQKAKEIKEEFEKHRMEMERKKWKKGA